MLKIFLAKVLDFERDGDEMSGFGGNEDDIDDDEDIVFNLGGIFRFICDKLSKFI